MSSRKLGWLFLPFIGSLMSFIHIDDDIVDKIASSLQLWTTNLPFEKVYVHTDKPYYIVGDTLWMKAYVTIGHQHQLSAKSGAIYIDLINDADSVVKSLKLPLVAGMAKGNFILADNSCKEGNYRVRAYTQWMRNAGSDYFYDKVLYVGNSITNPVFGKITYKYNHEGLSNIFTAYLQFEDEYGKALTGRKVNYHLRKDLTNLYSGTGVTTDSGTLQVINRSFSPDQLKGAYLSTSIHLEEESVQKLFPVKTIGPDIDVQFFPEGGQLVNGITSKIAFKATGTDGLGAHIYGVLKDENQQELAHFESQHLGMGLLSFQPEKGKSYHVDVHNIAGFNKTLPLPVAIDSGYVLSVHPNKLKDTAIVKINANSNIIADGSVIVMVHSGGQVYFADQVRLHKGMSVLKIPTSTLPSAIYQFTLFSITGQPLNERLVFIQNADQLALDLSSVQKVYKKRERVEINLDAYDQQGNPIIGSFSVSVINESDIPTDEKNETSIFSHLLLSADIKGYIEKPNYYFRQPTTKTKENLDILMLTQGYRRYNWPSLLSHTAYKPKYTSETLITEISGRVRNLLWRKPLSQVSVTLSSPGLGFYADTLSDRKGEFKFSNMLITEGVKFWVQGRKANNGKRVEVLLDRVRVQQLTINPNIGDLRTDNLKMENSAYLNSKKKEDEELRTGDLGRVQVLKEVLIKARVQRKEQTDGMKKIKEQIDQNLIFTAADSSKTLKDCLRKRDVKRLYFRPLSNEECFGYMPYLGTEPMTVYLNDRPLSTHGRLIPFNCVVADVMAMEPYDILRVDIVHSNKVVNPTMLIYTRSDYTTGDWIPSLISYSPRGFDTAKEFYSPKYDVEKDVEKLLDLRTTIYWNPDVKPRDGKASFSFYNADTPGTYRVLVEGLDSEGKLGRRVYRYQVE